MDRYENSENPQPMLFVFDKVVGYHGTKPDRLWISLDGNQTANLCMPANYFKPDIYPVVPFIFNLTVLDYFNKIADKPGTFNLKFSNDLLCEHNRKTCGITEKEYKNYVTISYAVNLVAYPNADQLRDDAIQACCLSKHVSRKLDPYEFSIEIAEHFLSELKNYPSIKYTVDKWNSYYDTLDYNKRTKYLYNEETKKFECWRDGKEILIEETGGILYDTEYYKSLADEEDN